MSAYERSFAARVAVIINKYVNRAARDVRASGKQTDLGISLDGMADDLRAIFEPHYRRVINAFGERVYDQFKSHPIFIETKDAEDQFAVATQQWLSRESSTKVVGITNTTLNQIRLAFDAGFADFATGTEVAKLIVKKTGGVIARTRAITISRTETHAASQVGSVEAMKSTNIPAKKVWVSAEDERTRETHISADSRYHDNPIGMDETFTVGGDSMTAPGLGSDAAENINCRCIVTYKTEG